MAKIKATCRRDYFDLPSGGLHIAGQTYEVDTKDLHLNGDFYDDDRNAGPDNPPNFNKRALGPQIIPKEKKEEAEEPEEKDNKAELEAEKNKLEAENKVLKDKKK